MTIDIRLYYRTVVDTISCRISKMLAMTGSDHNFFSNIVFIPNTKHTYTANHAHTAYIKLWATTSTAKWNYFRFFSSWSVWCV